MTKRVYIGLPFLLHATISIADDVGRPAIGRLSTFGKPIGVGGYPHGLNGGDGEGAE